MTNNELIEQFIKKGYIIKCKNRYEDIQFIKKCLDYGIKVQYDYEFPIDIDSYCYFVYRFDNETQEHRVISYYNAVEQESDKGRVFKYKEYFGINSEEVKQDEVYINSYHPTANYRIITNDDRFKNVYVVANSKKEAINKFINKLIEIEKDDFYDCKILEIIDLRD